MQNTSTLYKQLWRGKHTVETKLNINGVDYGEDVLVSIDTVQSVFADNLPQIGSCVSATIDVVMLMPDVSIPRMASLRPYIRLTDGTQNSEWIPKGVYYIDTRSVDDKTYAVPVLTISGYDSMLKAEQNFSTSISVWPSIDITVVNDIADTLGVDVDSRTTAIMTKGYAVELPAEYTCREVLGYIATMYGGCFIMTDEGKLRLITLSEVPAETSLLIDEYGDSLLWEDGVRILV